MKLTKEIQIALVAIIALVVLYLGLNFLERAESLLFE